MTQILVTQIWCCTTTSSKRESCSPWRPCRDLRDSNPIPLDRAQKVGPETCVTQKKGQPG